VSRPRSSTNLIVLLLVAVLACSSAAYAAGKSSGDALIKKKSLSGNRLKPDTVTGRQVREGTLAEVPKAASAGTAGRALLADRATVADGLAPLTEVPLQLNATWASSEPSAPPFHVVDGQGLVRLQGAVTRTGGSDNLITTLPPGARPIAAVYAPVVTTGFVIGAVGIAPNGEVRLQSGNTGFVSLDSITFLVD